MAENQFNAGDIVVLKSNLIHKMTIEKQNTDQTYKCVWQDKNCKKQFDDYAGVLLKLWTNQAGRFPIGHRVNFRP